MHFPVLLKGAYNLKPPNDSCLSTVPHASHLLFASFLHLFPSSFSLHPLSALLLSLLPLLSSAPCVHIQLAAACIPLGVCMCVRVCVCERAM